MKRFVEASRRGLFKLIFRDRAREFLLPWEAVNEWIANMVLHFAEHVLKIVL